MPTNTAARPLGPPDEVCPVCKSSSYMNQGIKFLVNPKCYHRLCEGCVDRKFAAGRATCPIAGCPQQLRRSDYRTQTFEDLTIEREVDIRKRVMKILNRREEEFETKRDWDDWLENREEMIMNLVTGVDVEATNRRLKNYETSNLASIKANASLEREELGIFKQNQEDEKEQIALRREASRQEYADERIAKANSRQAQLNETKMAVARQLDETRQQQRAKKAAGAKIGANNISAADDDDTLLKGLRKIVAPVAEKAYDPFMGMPVARESYDIRKDYPNYPKGPMMSGRTLQQAKSDIRVLAGGYDFEQFYDESLLRAFAGLGCFIEDEAPTKLGATPEPSLAPTKKAVDDVF